MGSPLGCYLPERLGKEGEGANWKGKGRGKGKHRMLLPHNSLIICLEVDAQHVRVKFMGADDRIRIGRVFNRPFPFPSPIFATKTQNQPQPTPLKKVENT